MFMDVEHMFSVQKHMFSVQKHKFSVQKHKFLTFPDFTRHFFSLLTESVDSSSDVVLV